MCDCFHLAFPNWHASAAGDGRRLKGPEQDFSDEFTCEEPEVLEGERPRPQGSSPVDDFPTTEKHRKQADDDLYESPTKSSKKRRIGLGSLFDKRSYPRTNLTEDGLTDPSEIITAKEVCAEGLVVGGGGKDGIFVKEVKPESPASKTLVAKEGDQILSATIYFENVSYEDALQILEHAQPYKMAFCLKRKPVSSATPGALETEHPTTATDAERKEEGERAEMRAQRKMKKQHDRISWPKFPSFSKGHRANFKRSHSTSEAEEHRKLEISPPTSDTESPIKSQLKSPDRKDKKKSHRMKLKMRMSGNRSKSVEEAQENEEDLTTDNLEVLKNQTIVDIEEEQPPPAITTEAENIEHTKEKYEFTTSSASHDVEILSKPSNTEAVIQGDEDVEQIERSELNICMKGNDKYEAVTESQQSLSSGNVASNLSIFKNLETFSVVSQTDPKENQEDVYHTQAIEEIQGPGENVEKIKDVASLDIPNEGRSKSPSISSYKEKIERGILETESYGIRTRGPLGDIATASHFEKNINSIEFSRSDSVTFEINTKPLPYYSSTPTAIEKSNVITRDIKCSSLVVDNSELTKQANVPQVLGKNSESKFKLPKVEVDFNCHARRQTDPTKAGFPKREEIEIPGMEDKKSKGNFPSATGKKSKIEKIINISKLDMGQAQKQTEEFNVECVKEAVSKFPAFKLPERDITGVLVQREITIMEKKLDKPGVSPRDSPCKMSFISTDVSAKLPEETMDVEQTVCPLAPSPKTKEISLDEKFASKSKTNKSKTLTELQQSDSDKLLARDYKMITPLEENFTFPKREDIEIPGMEATELSAHQQLVYGDQDGATQDKVVKEFPVAAATEKSQGDNKGQEKKSKKSKVSLPSFGIMTPDIRFPGLSIDLQMKSYKSKSPDDLREMKSRERSQDEEHGSIEKVCKPHATDKECAKQNESQFGKASVWHQEESINEAEQIEHTISRDTNIIVSPQKKKLLNLKMPKIGKSIKGMTEATSMVMETAPENSTFEVIPDSENKSCDTGTKIVFEADKIVRKIKIPSIDVSVPKLKMPKTEGKLLEGETRISKPHSNALTQHDLNQKTGPTKQCIDAQEDVGFNVTKFGISLEKENTQSNVLPEKAEQLSGTAYVKTTGLQQTEIKEKDPKTKKMKILFPNFGFSNSDVSGDRESLLLKQDPTQEKVADGMEADLKNNTNYTEFEFKNSEDSASKFKLPTIKLSNFEVSFPKTAEVKTGVQMLETSTKEMNVDVNITENKWIEAPPTSEQKIVDFSYCDVSPVLNISTPKRNVFSETEDKINLLDQKVQATDLSKPSSEDTVFNSGNDCSVHKSNLEIKESNLISKFGDVHKDLNITASVELDSEALPTTVFDDFLTKKHEGVDVSVEPKPKKDLKELPRIDSCLPHADDNKPEDRELALGTVQLESKNIESIQKAEVSKKSPTKFKLPSITFPKLTFSKATDSELDDQLPEVTTSAELPEAELSVPEIKVSHQIPDERSGTEDSKDTKYLEDKGLDKDATLSSEALDVIIQEGKEKDSEQKIKKRKISFPKFGFSKSEAKILENTVPAVEMPEPECEVTESEVARPVHEVQSKNKSTTGSPSKFKLPTISLPKFDISVSKPEKDLVKSEQKASYEKTKVDSTEVSTQDVGLSKTVLETVAVDAEIKTQEEAQETQEKFMLPKFEFSLPKLKIPELKQFSLGTEKAQNSSEAVTYDSEIVTQCASDLIDTSFPAEEVKEQLPSDLDIKSDGKSLTMREMEAKAFEPDSIPKTEILKDAKTSGGSPIKFKLPAFKIPKFGSLSSKSKPEIKDACHYKTSEPTDVLSVDHADTDKLIGLTAKTDLPKEKPSVPKIDIENKVDSQDDSFKVPGMKLKQKTAFSFPKFGFSKAEIKDSVVDVNSSQFDSSEPKDDLEDFDKSEVNLKDLTIDGTTDKVKLPVINSSSGRKSTKIDKIIPEESNRPDVRGLDPQIKKPDETLHVDVKDPSFVEEHLNDLKKMVNVEDIADKEHKCVIALQEIDTKHQDVFIEVNVPMPEQEFEELEENLKTNSMPDIKVKEDPSTDLPKPKIEDKRVDNSSEAEDEQNNATIFSFPTKFKVPSISLPKFGFKSQKMELDNVVTDSDLNLTVSENEVKEKSPAVPDVHYKEQQDKDKKTDFSFPKIAFSKSDLDEKFSESKEGMYNETGTGAEKGADSTTTFQMYGNRLSTIELKKPELSLPLVDIETTKSVVNESDDKVSALIPVIHKEVKTTETIIDALSDKSAVLLPEENISSLPDLNMSFAGKAESSSADLKSQDEKIPKTLLAFSKPDEKSQDVVTCQPKTSITLQVSNLLDKEDSESTHEQHKKEGPKIASQSRFKLPSFNLPKFGIRNPKENAEITNTNIDINKTAALKQINEMKKHVDTEGLSGGVVNKSKDNNQPENKETMKLSKLGQVGQNAEQTLLETDDVTTDVLSVDKKELILNKESVEIEEGESNLTLPKIGISQQGHDIGVVSTTTVGHSQAIDPILSTTEAQIIYKPTVLDEKRADGRHVKTDKSVFAFPKFGFSKSEIKVQDMPSNKSAADMSAPVCSTEKEEKDVMSAEVKTTSPFGSPTKFKLPTIKLPKFGVSAKFDSSKTDHDTKEIANEAVEDNVGSSSQDVTTKPGRSEILSIETCIKETGDDDKENAFKIPKFGIVSHKEIGHDVKMDDVRTPEAEAKLQEDDFVVQKMDTASKGLISSIKNTEEDTELKADAVASKFKLPAIKIPSFAISVPKTSKSKVKTSGVEISDTKKEKTEDRTIQAEKSKCVVEIETTKDPQQPSEASVKNVDGNKGSPSKFKLPTMKRPKLSISRTKSHDEDDSTLKANVSELNQEAVDLYNKSKFSMQSMGEVIKGFEVELNVSTREDSEALQDKLSEKTDNEVQGKVEELPECREQEKSKFKFKFPKLGFSQTSDDSEKLNDAKIEENEKLEGPSGQEVETKPDKGGWFKFSRFSSPTKSDKSNEKEYAQPKEKIITTDLENDSSKAIEILEKSSPSKIVDENISPTLSLRSSEAFADVSSTLTTEQVCNSQESTSKVKVKYFEPVAAFGVNEVQTKVVTSTARCELISMEPDLPEKVNIPYSSDLSSASVDTFKQMTGEIHVITSNIQAIPDSQKSAILTSLDAQGRLSSPLPVTIASDPVLTVEETRVLSGELALMEHHVVKEATNDDKETVLVTRTTRVFEEDSFEPISDETALSIQRLKDSVHTEKMRFFESVEVTKEVKVVNTETLLRHMDSSAEENNGT